jgi:hypothetical protein
MPLVFGSHSVGPQPSSRDREPRANESRFANPANLLFIVSKSASQMAGTARATFIASLAALALASCTALAEKKKPLPREVAPEVVQLAELPKHDFKECSGLVASRQFPGVLWTHNDGTDRRLFAINRQGQKLAEFEVQGVLVWDFEELSIDATNRLYVADIGNNLEVRPSLAVHRLAEPNPKEKGRALKVERSWLLRFPAKSFDAEGLVIQGDHGYLIRKIGGGKKAELYRWPLSTNSIIALEEVGKLEVRSRVTGAALSRDGSRLAMTADDGVYVLQLPHGMEKAIKVSPFRVPFTLGQIEGCDFAEDGLLVVSETRELFLFRAAPFVLGPSK